MGRHNERPAVLASGAWRASPDADNGLVLQRTTDRELVLVDHFSPRSPDAPAARGVAADMIYQPPRDDTWRGRRRSPEAGRYDVLVVRTAEASRQGGNIYWIERVPEHDGSTSVYLFDLGRSVDLGVSRGEDRVFKIDTRASKDPIRVGANLTYRIDPQSRSHRALRWREVGPIVEIMGVQRPTDHTARVLATAADAYSQRITPQDAAVVSEPNMWDAAVDLYVTAAQMALQREGTLPEMDGR